MPATLLALFGGSGTRFGLPYPKQFVEIDGEPLLAHVLRAYEGMDEIDEILVVSEANSIALASEIAFREEFSKVASVIAGGSTRQQSARIGLEFLKEQGIESDKPVLLVDGDRPCVEHRYVKQCLEAIKPGVGAVTAIPCVDSLLLGKEGYVDRYIPREGAYRVQTPQAFCFEDIYNAHEASWMDAYTDDASLALHAGMKIAIVMGSEENIKITAPQDLETYQQWKARRK